MVERKRVLENEAEECFDVATTVSTEDAPDLLYGYQ
jgi:hypothetical protein